MKKGVKIVGMGLLGLIGLLILFVLLVSIFSNDDTEDGYTLDILAREQVLVSEIRLEIFRSAVDSSGKITETQCEGLKNIVYKYNPEADWFGYCGISLSVDAPDTDKTAKIQLSRDGRCAILTLDKEETKVIDYEFKEEPCKGYYLDVIKE